MTKEEMLKKIGELSPEQKDFLREEIKKHSPKAKETTDVLEESDKENSSENFKN